MNFDQMLETWRTQDEAPLYGVNRDLLQLVIQQEEADLKSGLGLELWLVYAMNVGFAGLVAGLFASIHEPRTAWDYAAAGIAVGALLLWAGAYWVSRRRKAQRDRGFGNSLQEEIRRHLSLIDYQFSRHGRRVSSLLIGLPVMVASIMIYWLAVRTTGMRFGWPEVGFVIFLVAFMSFVNVWGSHLAEKNLLPRRHRLSRLLELLNSSE